MENRMSDPQEYINQRMSLLINMLIEAGREGPFADDDTDYDDRYGYYGRV